MNKNGKTNKVVHIKDTQSDSIKEKITVKNDEAILIINGEATKLESFVLAGDDAEQNRIVLAYNTSLNEALVYKETLNVQIQQQLIDELNKKD